MSVVVTLQLLADSNQGERIMPQSSFISQAAATIARPLCSKCSRQMWLARIEPFDPNHDMRTFECPACDHSESIVVKYK